jgi:hypothetical protein
VRACDISKTASAFQKLPVLQGLEDSVSGKASKLPMIRVWGFNFSDTPKVQGRKPDTIQDLLGFEFVET